jgi:bifunctional non-homologous end joining protein LigD
MHCESKVSRASSPSGAIARTNRASAPRCGRKCAYYQRRDFAIEGYTPAGRNFGTILIGDYESGALKYVAKVRGGFTPATRDALFKQFDGFETKTCPFENLPEARRGQWGEGLTAAEMEKCRWLEPRLVATIDYLERRAANHLRHAVFVGCRIKSGPPPAKAPS